MIELVGWIAVGMAVISFVLFGVSTVTNISTQSKNASVPSQAATALAAGGAHFAPATAPSVPELTDLFKALASVIDSVVKAGPSLAGLVASMAFLVIAAWTAAQGVKADLPTCTLTKEAVGRIRDASIAVADIPLKCETPSAAKKI